MNEFLAQGREVKSDSIGYILRCNEPGLTSRNGFQWVWEGNVEAPDWSPAPECGNGLHGWLWGAGDHTFSGHWKDDDAVWLVAAVWLSDIVDLGGKVKFPRATVVYSGTRDEATREIVRLGSKKPVMFVNLTCGDNESQVGGYKARLTGGYGSTNTGGDESINKGGEGSTNTGGDESINKGGDDSTNTGDYWSTNTGGNRSTNTGGAGSTNTGGAGSTNKGGYWSTNKGDDRSTNTGGDYSTNTGGYRSTNTGGDASTLQGGEKSTLTWKLWDGDRYRFHTYYVGEGGILPNVPYKFFEGKPVAQG